MVKPRVVETDEGIQGTFIAETYDKMMRRLRDKGWIEIRQVLKAGICSGLALEIGPGPGYLGLEWLKATNGTRLKGLEISPNMIRIAERNAREYGLEDRVQYVRADAGQMPFGENRFDGVFTNGSLHEWSGPIGILNEIARVLKPGGRYCISDLRRDMNPAIKWLMKLNTKPKEIRPGLLSSIGAAYTLKELAEMLEETNLQHYELDKNVIGVVATGEKS
jgi:ubiquinone/menaquinone biosynthesis C-methylase UbiE